MKVFLLSIFSAFVLTAQGAALPKLLLVQVVLRHGDRHPIKRYPNDPNFLCNCDNNGTLTRLGKQQAYGLGTYLRKRYEHFITSNPKEITANSSSVDRCVLTAQTSLAAFFKPSRKFQFHPLLPWQPINVHNVPKTEDMYLSGVKSCPMADRAFAAGLKKNYNNLIAKHKEMVHVLSRSGEELDTALSLGLLHDTLDIESRYHLLIPAWARHYLKELKESIEPLTGWFAESPIVQRLRGGPILGRIINDMQKKTKGLLPRIKVRLYSTHDFLLAIIMEALKVYNKRPIPYCASLIFELYSLNTGEPSVRLIFLNSTTPEDVDQVPHVLTLQGCSEYCPLDSFVRITESLIPTNWNEECKLDKELMVDMWS